MSVKLRIRITGRWFPRANVANQVILLLAVVLVVSPPSLAVSRKHSALPQEKGEILNVRKVLLSTPQPYGQHPYLQIHQFAVYFGVRIGEQTFCADYRTVVLDEIEYLKSNKGNKVPVSRDKKKRKVVIYRSDRRKIKAHLVPENPCSPIALAKQASR